MHNAPLSLCVRKKLFIPDDEDEEMSEDSGNANGTVTVTGRAGVGDRAEEAAPRGVKRPRPEEPRPEPQDGADTPGLKKFGKFNINRCVLQNRQ